MIKIFIILIASYTVKSEFSLISLLNGTLPVENSVAPEIKFNIAVYDNETSQFETAVNNTLQIKIAIVMENAVEFVVDDNSSQIKNLEDNASSIEHLEAPKVQLSFVIYNNKTSPLGTVVMGPRSVSNVEVSEPTTNFFINHDST